MYVSYISNIGVYKPQEIQWVASKTVLSLYI